MWLTPRKQIVPAKNGIHIAETIRLIWLSVAIASNLAMDLAGLGPRLKGLALAIFCPTIRNQHSPLIEGSLSYLATCFEDGGSGMSPIGTGSIGEQTPVERE
jgi:hypothetical protein